MNSTQVYNQIICEVNCRYGAPMGRGGTGTDKPDKDKKVYCRRVYLNSGGYDRGGAYWGFGSPLYVEYTLDRSHVRFFRK
ncbi:MAG: hypothetical protein LUD15_06300 [Bacteroides sp.]|nr:hypothetical protein [Bacteroides sp.]